MAAVIRLARHGGKKTPFYRIVVTDRRYSNDGSRLEQLGIYDPRQTPVLLRIKADRLEAWLKQGALPSPTVKQLIKQSGVQNAAPQDAAPQDAAPQDAAPDGASEKPA